MDGIAATCNICINLRVTSKDVINLPARRLNRHYLVFILWVLYFVFQCFYIVLFYCAALCLLNGDDECTLVE